jgi:hypothetical protein
VKLGVESNTELSAVASSEQKVEAKRRTVKMETTDIFAVGTFFRFCFEYVWCKV